MVQVFGTVERSVVQDGEQITVFRIPAFASSGARQRARANARIKGLNNPSIESVEEVGNADVPGQSFYDVEITSAR